AVIDIAATIEDHLFDSLGGGALGDQLAHRFGGLDITAGFQVSAQRLVERRSRGQRGAAHVVDHLRVDVLARAVHGQPHPALGVEPDRPAHARFASVSLVTQWLHDRLPSLLLAFLAEDVLTGIPDALALVRLGRPETANLRGDLADLLLVDAGDDDLDRPRRGDRDAIRDRIVDLVAVAEPPLQVL